jgi:urease accessory protein
VLAGVTAPQPRVIVLRALAHRIEPAMALAQAVRARWRELAWQLEPVAPRVWRT